LDKPEKTHLNKYTPTSVPLQVAPHFNYPTLDGTTRV